MKMPHMGPPIDPLILNAICKMVGPSCVEIDASRMVNRPKVTADTPKINNKIPWIENRRTSLYFKLTGAKQCHASGSNVMMNALNFRASKTIYVKQFYSVLIMTNITKMNNISRGQFIQFHT